MTLYTWLYHITHYWSMVIPSLSHYYPFNHYSPLLTITNYYWPFLTIINYFWPWNDPSTDLMTIFLIFFTITNIDPYPIWWSSHNKLIIYRDFHPFQGIDQDDFHSFQYLKMGMIIPSRPSSDARTIAQLVDPSEPGESLSIASLSRSMMIGASAKPHGGLHGAVAGRLRLRSLLLMMSEVYGIFWPNMWIIIG